MTFAAVLFDIFQLEYKENNTTICFAYSLRVLQLVGFFNNLLNLCGMSVDHFIGVAHSINYRSIMTTRVSTMIIIAIWSTSFSLGLFDLLINIFMRQQEVQTRSDFIENMVYAFNTSTIRSSRQKLSKQAEMLLSLVETEQNFNTESIASTICLTNHKFRMWLEVSVLVLGLSSATFLTILYSLVVRSVASNYEDSQAKRKLIFKLIGTVAMLLTAFLVWYSCFFLN